MNPPASRVKVKEIVFRGDRGNSRGSCNGSRSPVRAPSINRGTERGGLTLPGRVPSPPRQAYRHQSPTSHRRRSVRRSSTGAATTAGPPGYRLLDELGRGGCATVYQGVAEASGQPVAIKKFDKLPSNALLLPHQIGSERQIAKAQSDYDSACREITVLRALKGPGRICELVEVIEGKRVLWMVLELCAGATLSRGFTVLRGESIAGKRIYTVRPTETLYNVIIDNAGYGCAFIRELVRQILEGLAQLVSSGYVHGDLKPDNVMLTLVNALPSIKLIDLGSAFRPITGARSQAVATLEYMPPEALLGDHLTEVSAWTLDTWALGAMMLEWCTMAPLWLSYPCRAYLQPNSLASRRLRQEEGYVTFPHGGLFAVSGKDPNRIAQRQMDVVTELPYVLDPSRHHQYCPGIPLGSWRHGIDFLTQLLALHPEDRLSVRLASVHPFVAASHV